MWPNKGKVVLIKGSDYQKGKFYIVKKDLILMAMHEKYELLMKKKEWKLPG